MKKHFFRIVLLIAGIYLTYDYFDNRNKIENLNYGIKANELRKSISVPIIDDYMTAKNRHDEFFGNRWESWKNKPKENEILHAWKNVVPSENKKNILNEEIDAYRVKESNGRIKQLNIYSKIVNDSILTRTGSIFYTTEPRESLELNEIEINSILKNWKLNYLVKR